MEIANSIIIYAWIGIFVVTGVTVFVGYIAGLLMMKTFDNLKCLYKLECIKYYFAKMEKEGTHVFKNKS